MPGLNRLGDVRSPERPPAHEVLWGDQDPAVCTGPTAGATGEAVELRSHGSSVAASRIRGIWSDPVDFARNP